jgi:site-specific recombinase XerC
MQGVDLRTVGELLGHRSFQMTMRYAHLAADHKRSAVARLDRPGGASVSHGRAKRSDASNCVVHVREWRNWQTHLV